MVPIGKRVTHPIPQLVKRRAIKETTKVTPDRLGSDLAATIGIGGLAATAEATVVQLAIRRRKQAACPPA
jgi:hypothetical protein